MPAKSIDIEEFLTLRNHVPVFDVRSPSEYRHAHIPGAYSFPLFTDEERKVVGTEYKQQSRQQAIKLGLNFFGPKMVKMVEEMDRLVCESKTAQDNPAEETNRKKTVIVHCWRGGMRSAGVAWLLDLYGYKVYVVKGGYKNFRQWCHHQFSLPIPIRILGGYTGSGKTEILQLLQKQHSLVIDLEGLANHKGSAFGSIGMPEQPTQEMFENLLALQLCQIKSPKPVFATGGNEKDHNIAGLLAEDRHESPLVWIEDESQRIGQVNIPIEFYHQMRSALVFFLDIPFEERLKYLVKDYGKGDKEMLINAIIRIKKRLGGLETKTAINHLLEDDLVECFRILLVYYDKYYTKGLQNRDDWQSLTHTISCSTVDAEKNISKLLQVHQPAQVE